MSGFLCCCCFFFFCLASPPSSPLDFGHKRWATEEVGVGDQWGVWSALTNHGMESQTHRTAWVGRDLKDHPVSTPCKPHINVAKLSSL